MISAKLPSKKVKINVINGMFKFKKSYRIYPYYYVKTFKYIKAMDMVVLFKNIMTPKQ